MGDGVKCVALTGAEGFLGWHLRCRMKGEPDYEVRPVFQADFDSEESLARALGPAEIVIHLAGMNRGAEQDIYDTNLKLAQVLTNALDRQKTTPTILFANSTHSFGDSAFGRSKRGASEILSRWAESHGSRYVDIVLPHLFGEGGKPFYNSAFATFCYQLVSGEEPQVNLDGQVELIHAQQASQCFLEWAADSRIQGQVRVVGTPMKISEVLMRLQAIRASYSDGIVPDLSKPLDLDFFNTYRSYLYPGHYPVDLCLHKDNRGQLFEAIKSFNGGQTFLSTTHPGITRGRHYHRHKVERFLVVSGEAEIRIRRLFDVEGRIFRVSGDTPCYIDMPTFHTHDITNIGKQDLLTLFWSHEIFDSSHPDTYAESVIV